MSGQNSSGVVALLAPTGRDAVVAEQVLGRAGFATRVCSDMSRLCECLDRDAGVALLAEEALSGQGRTQLLDALAAQPSWSDLPLVVLTGDGELSRGIPRVLESLLARANVTLLERPVRVATLVTALRSALRARHRQLDVRDHLEERARAERTLRESESRLRDAVLAAPYPLVLYAGDGEVLQLSHAWTALTGYGAEALRTTTDWKRLALGHRETQPGPLLGAGEWAVRTASGESQTWDVHTVALAPLPDGRPLHLAAAINVTTFRRLIEREREARAQAEEAHAQAEAARRRADVANRAKSDFLAAMSHELRTPLNAIGGYAQLMSMGVRGPVNDQQREDLARIDRSQRHLLSLINDILNFAKIEAGHVSFDIRPVRVREMLMGLEPLIAPQLQTKSIQYRDDGRHCDAAVLADEDKARQILLNLLSNAIKFTPMGGSIVVDCTVDGALAHLSVQDSGIGVPREKQAAIFEPFVQLQRTFSSAQEGTGLGLAISRDLARRMGGELRVASAGGEGATFTLSLPLAESGA